MNTKYTPGPWKFHTNGEANSYALITKADNRWVISVQQNGEMLTDQQLANGRLISAAPELLEDHVSDLALIEELLSDLRSGVKRDVNYFLENLIVSKKAIIAKATV